MPGPEAVGATLAHRHWLAYGALGLPLAMAALPVDGRTWHVDFDDWMFLVDDEVMLNRSVISKWGFRLGEALARALAAAGARVALSARRGERIAAIAYAAALTPLLLKHGSGQIAFVSSVAGYRGLPAIQRIFSHMFSRLEAPRFRVEEKLVSASGAMLVWTFRFGSRHLGGSAEIRVVSHLRFDAAGKVRYHRDYWDAAEELYMKLPALGWLMRTLRRLAAV